MNFQSILPPGYDYVICNLFPFETYNGEDRFSTVFRLPFGAAEEAEQWLYEFQSSSKTTWRVDKTYPDPQTKVIFKVLYRFLACVHISQDEFLLQITWFWCLRFVDMEQLWCCTNFVVCGRTCRRIIIASTTLGQQVTRTEISRIRIKRTQTVPPNWRSRSRNLPRGMLFQERCRRDWLFAGWFQICRCIRSEFSEWIWVLPFSFSSEVPF